MSKTMTKAETHTGIDLSQWEVTNPVDTDQYYNCDAVIEAYVKGEKDGLKNEQKVVFNQFTQNVEFSKLATVKFMKHMDSLGFIPKSAYLKFHSFDAFECMIAVNENDFIKDDFLKLYDVAAALENDYHSDVFNLSFSFMPSSDEDFEDSVRHDGFIYRFRKTS